MEIILTCRECGYRERGRGGKELMTRIRMYNHMRREHEELYDPQDTTSTTLVNKL